jgi:hypothetical protein
VRDWADEADDTGLNDPAFYYSDEELSYEGFALEIGTAVTVGNVGSGISYYYDCYDSCDLLLSKLMLGWNIYIVYSFDIC